MIGTIVHGDFVFFLIVSVMHVMQIILGMYIA